MFCSMPAALGKPIPESPGPRLASWPGCASTWQAAVLRDAPRRRGRPRAAISRGRPDTAVVEIERCAIFVCVPLVEREDDGSSGRRPCCRRAEARREVCIGGKCSAAGRRPATTIQLFAARRLFRRTGIRAGGKPAPAKFWLRRRGQAWERGSPRGWSRSDRGSRSRRCKPGCSARPAGCSARGRRAYGRGDAARCRRGRRGTARAQIMLSCLARMREHGHAAVLRNGAHGIADVHVGDVAIADAAVLEQAAVQRAVGGAHVGSSVSAAMRCCLYRQVEARPSARARSASTGVAGLHQAVELPEAVRVAALEERAEGDERGRVLAEAEAEHVHLAVALEVVGAHLDAARHLHPEALAEHNGTVQAARGVVVRERDAPDAALCGPGRALPRRCPNRPTKWCARGGRRRARRRLPAVAAASDVSLKHPFPFV